MYKMKKFKRYNHGYSKHPLYFKYRDMRNRCYNKKVDRYHRYGGRGIRVCKEWMGNPKIFIEWSLKNGWEKELTLDRIDLDKNYSPDNCQYITPQEQHYNKSTTKYIYFLGVKYCFAEFIKLKFSHEFYKAYHTIWHHLKTNKTDVLSSESYLYYLKKYKINT